ncbi:MAG: radical SAM protein [Myxococcota bacterium]
MDTERRLQLTAPTDCPELDGSGPQAAAAFTARAEPVQAPSSSEEVLLRPLQKRNVVQELPKRARGLGIYETRVGNQTVPMLRTMMTTVCDKACGYCPFGRTRDFRRSSWRPEELADTVLKLREAGMIQGLFLTSGLATAPRRIMDRMLATVDILRARGFQDYVHLKMLPGADTGQVAEAMRLATRVSVNLEAPTPEVLRRLAPEKDLGSDLAVHVRTTSDLAARFPQHAPRGGVVTQFVVGPGGETDRTLMDAASRLYRRWGVRRVYYSGFIPVMGTPMEGVLPTPPIREARLYQADWLLRFYGYRMDELPFDPRGMLPEGVDPKAAFALAHPDLFPVEVNRAPRELLLRVPGLGPQSVTRILQHRRAQPLRAPSDLKRLGAVVSRAQDFLLFDGKHFPAPRPVAPAEQLRLFDQSLTFGRMLGDGRRIVPQHGGTYV